MRYVVTGAAGFIGSTLANRLVEAGHDVVFDLVTTTKGGVHRDFPHYYLTIDECAVEISVYPHAELRRPQRSSITHRTMERATLRAVRRLIEEAGSLEGGSP